MQQPASNQRWCSDIFLIPCWSGEVLSVAFAIDCHDREVLAWTASPRPLNGGDIRTLMDQALWARFGEAALTAPHAIQWLSDNGPQYTATATVLYAHELGLVPITTPAYSPESNGLAEAFVQTFKRDYAEPRGRAAPGPGGQFRARLAGGGLALGHAVERPWASRHDVVWLRRVWSCASVGPGAATARLHGGMARSNDFPPRPYSRCDAVC